MSTRADELAKQLRLAHFSIIVTSVSLLAAQLVKAVEEDVDTRAKAANVPHVAFNFDVIGDEINLRGQGCDLFVPVRIAYFGLRVCRPQEDITPKRDSLGSLRNSSLDS